MSLRKHYLDTHRAGIVVLIENEANRQAATNPGERVAVVAGHAVMILGDPPAGALERFAADGELMARSIAALAA